MEPLYAFLGISSPPPDAQCDKPVSTDFVSRLRSALALMRPAPSIHHRSKAYISSEASPGVPPSLVGASHVYVRVDSVRRPLTRPYVGPFRVLERSPKTFVLSRAGCAWTFSVDRLKPAWGFMDGTTTASPAPVPAPAPSTPRPPAPAPARFPTTRSGRVTRPPARFLDN